MAVSFSNINIVLASGSPRRQQFFKDMGLAVSLKLKPVKEVYPPEITGTNIPLYLAKLKAKPFEKSLTIEQLLITSDTIVWHNNTALGKPKTPQEAINMLTALSGEVHQVFTAVCFTFKGKQTVCEQATTVTFNKLSQEEIHYYVKHYKPFDKAGAYGIQEWIGLIGIKDLKGSYNNVVGLPTEFVYRTLKKLLGEPTLK